MMSKKLPGMSPDELVQLVRVKRCACRCMTPCASGHVWDPETQEVYLVVKCRNCKRARVVFLGDIFQWYSSFEEDELLWPIDGRALYAQKSLLS